MRRMKPLFARRVVDWHRVQRAPKVPGGHRPPRRPAIADLAHLEFGQGFAVIEMQPHRSLQTDVVDRQDIRPHHEEYKKHLRGPAADALDLCQLVDQLLVVQVAPAGKVQRSVEEVLGEIDEISGFLAGEAAGAQANRVHSRHGSRAEGTHRFEQFLPHAFGGLHRNLLADYRARQRDEGVAAALEMRAGMVANQNPEHRIAPGEFVDGLRPVGWRH
jgi:hypothetical protein